MPHKSKKGIRPKGGPEMKKGAVKKSKKKRGTGHKGKKGGY